ncbi:hypothetical protein ES705_04856 [subsurface metagenome]
MSVKKIGPVKESSWDESGVRVKLEAREETFYVCDDTYGVRGKSREERKVVIEKIKDVTQTKPIRVAGGGSSSNGGFGLYWAKGPEKLNLSEFYYLYRGSIYRLDRQYSENEILLLIMDYEDKERRKFERLKKKFDLAQKVERQPRRESIPEEVRIAVWRRDGGKCARCGSREKLEYDHIIPISKGGSNTARNIELLCESCNRKKKNNII